MTLNQNIEIAEAFKESQQKVAECLFSNAAERLCRIQIDVFPPLPVTSDHPGTQTPNFHRLWQGLIQEKEKQVKRERQEQERSCFEIKLLHSFDSCYSPGMGETL